MLNGHEVLKEFDALEKLIVKTYDKQNELREEAEDLAKALMHVMFVLRNEFENENASKASEIALSALELYRERNGEWKPLQ